MITTVPLFFDGMIDFRNALPPGYSLHRHRVHRSGLMGKIWARWMLAFVEIRRDS